MMKKLNEMSIAAYVKTMSFFNELKNDERGLSGVVVAVLLILVAVLAVVALWGSLSKFLEGMWSDISSKAQFPGKTEF